MSVEVVVPPAGNGEYDKTRNLFARSAAVLYRFMHVFFVFLFLFFFLKKKASFDPPGHSCQNH